MTVKKGDSADGAQKNKAAESESPKLIQMHGGAWMQTEHTGRLMQAMAKAAGQYGTIPQNGTMSRGGRAYTYAKIGDLVNAIRPTLSKSGLTHTQAVIEGVNGERVTCYLINRVTHGESGQFIETRTIIPYSKNPQDLGSSITYFRRYTTQCLLNLAPDEDDDGVAAQDSSQAAARLREAESKARELQNIIRNGENLNAQQAQRIGKLEAELLQARGAAAGDHQGQPRDDEPKAKAAQPKRKAPPIKVGDLTDRLNQLDLTLESVNWLRELLGKKPLGSKDVADHHRGAFVTRLARNETARTYYKQARAGLQEYEDPAEQRSKLFDHIRNVVGGQYSSLQKNGTVVPASLVKAFTALNLDDCVDFDSICDVGDMIAEAADGRLL